MEELEPNVTLSFGADTLRPLAAIELSWTQMFCEWIDNSLDVGATVVEFEVERGRSIKITDNGKGCADPRVMVETGSRHGASTTAGLYGMGGTLSFIVASQAGKISIRSVTDESVEQIAVDWKNCQVRDELGARLTHLPRQHDEPTGTSILLELGKVFRDPEGIAADLGFRYFRALRNGLTIKFTVGGENFPVVAYQPPPFLMEINLSGDLNGKGFRIEGGLVEQGVKNPRSGFFWEWGHRILGESTDHPSEGRPTNRLSFVVSLDSATWRNITLTKTGFIDHPEELVAAVAERCRAIVDASEQQADAFELADISRELEAVLGPVLGLKGHGQDGRKGVRVRPEKPIKPGAVEPVGSDRRHQKFKQSQPAGHGVNGRNQLGNRSNEVRVNWDGTMDEVFRFAVSGQTFNITLNPAIPAINRLKGKTLDLATLCTRDVAHYLATETTKQQRKFPAFENLDFQQIYRHLLEKLVPAAAEQQPSRRGRARAVSNGL